MLLLLDSLTRFAEAHREIALAAGEPAELRGFPPSTVGADRGALRAGRAGAFGDGRHHRASSRVLVAGSDMDEPVADMLRGVLDGHVVLDRGIAERGRFPAIDRAALGLARRCPRRPVPSRTRCITARPGACSAAMRRPS